MADDQSHPALIVSPGQRFGRRLREQRERRGITLDTIAASTKIKTSLFAGLERGDVSDWPAGIFRRAFVREYARGIGLAPEPVVAEFVQIFGAADAGDEADRAPAAPGALRLTLAVEPEPVSSVLAPALIGLIEAASLVLVAAVAGWVLGLGFGITCCALLLVYYPIATAYAGCTPANWFLSHGMTIGDPRRAPDRSAPAADIRDRLYLVKSATEPERVDGRADDADVDADSPRRRSAGR
jgi:transcriptional regulator with XRE-family HTH domain